MKEPLLYLDAETTGLDPEQKITSFSTDINELLADFITWAKQNSLDMENLSYADIRYCRSRMLKYVLDINDDYAVILTPVKYSLWDKILHMLRIYE